MNLQGRWQHGKKDDMVPAETICTCRPGSPAAAAGVVVGFRQHIAELDVHFSPDGVPRLARKPVTIVPGFISLAVFPRRPRMSWKQQWGWC